MLSSVVGMFSSLLCWFGGGDSATLEDVATERMRVAATGMAVLCTGAIATCSSLITVYKFMRAPVPLAVSAGLFWGIVIVCLDRWLLLSLRRQARAWQTMLSVVPRIALAVAGGYVFTIPLLMLAFNSQVAFVAKLAHRTAGRVAQAQIDNFYTPRINALTRKESSIEKTLTTSVSAPYLHKDPIYRADVQRAQQLQTEATKAQSAAIGELAGTSGTHHSGAGDVYDAKESRARTIANELSGAQAAVTARAKLLGREEHRAISQTQGVEGTSLHQVERRLDTLRGQQAQAESRLRQEEKQPIGLSDRLAALQKVEESNFGTLSWAIALDLLILLADAGPVINKLLLLLGPDGAYERAQTRREEHTEQRVAARHEGELQAAKISAREETAQAELHKELWDAELEDLMPIVVRTQSTVIRMTIEDWAEGELDEAKARRRKAHAYRDLMRAAREHAAQTSGGGEYAGSRSARPRGADRRRWWR
jgi:hypothetical protein